MEKRITIHFLKPGLILFAGIALAVTLLLVLTSTPQAAGKALPPGQTSQPGNAECLLCHDEPDQIFTFPNGDTVSTNINPSEYGRSAHGLELMRCVECHTDISGYPHPQVTETTRKEYRATYMGLCRDCHEEQAEQLQDSIHGTAMAAGNENAPLCMDCHDPHRQQPVRDSDGVLTRSTHYEIPQTCARCHSQIFDQYAESVHGSGIILENNPDVPTCTDCHGVHQIEDPLSAHFRLSSPEICSNCHTDEETMSKYGLSTAVLNTYVSDFHGTTVTLFEKTTPDELTNKAVCYDCHGIHDISRTDDPQKGLQVKENLLLTCKKCHPDATTNFPDSWMSHYIPSKEHYPLVYYVNLFYKFFIPTVLGGMAIFVISDLSRRVINRRRKGGGPAAVMEAPPPGEAPPGEESAVEEETTVESAVEPPSVEEESAIEEETPPESAAEPLPGEEAGVEPPSAAESPAESPPGPDVENSEEEARDE